MLTSALLYLLLYFGVANFGVANFGVAVFGCADLGVVIWVGPFLKTVYRFSFELFGLIYSTIFAQGGISVSVIFGIQYFMCVLSSQIYHCEYIS